MRLLTPNLRRWFIASAIALICVVAGFYLYSRHRVQNALKQVPEKIGIEIQQSANGFTISKSVQGRTLFKIEAGKVVQFKGGKRGELHDVEITVYGRDAARFDRIKGRDFEYDSGTGDITGKGEVEIDLEPNPAGGASPDQSIPSGLKDPIHLQTTDLVFNQKSGDAHAAGEVEFSVAQASGSASGLTYIARTSVLTLDSKVVFTLGGMAPISMQANRLSLSRSPPTAVLDRPHLVEGSQHLDAGKLTAFLSPSYKLQRVHAEGNVLVRSDGPDGAAVTMDELDLEPGARNSIRLATLSGNVVLKSAANPGVEGKAGRTILNFQNDIIKDVHADHGVTLTHLPDSKGGKQSFVLASPAIDFSVARGRLIHLVETSGPPQITLSSNDGDKMGDQTLLTAGKFWADFDSGGKLSQVRGSPDVRVVSKSFGKPDRVTTSQSVEATFDYTGQIASLTQKGNFSYSDGETNASASTAQYLLQDQTLFLVGSARLQNKGNTTTAETIRLNRAIGTVDASGNVKTTHLPLQPQNPEKSRSNALHIAAERASVTSHPAIALYRGNVRIWQDANSVQAPAVRFDQDQLTVTADGNSGNRVLTSLNQFDSKGKVTVVAISADHLTYSQEEGVIRLTGDVHASTAALTLTASHMDCFMDKRAQTSDITNLVPGGNIQKVLAYGGVLITEPGRHVTGDKLVYTASDDKYVMTGGPPSIFDAEHGNVTGVSLTLFGHDARVLVEGSNQTPSVSRIRVAR